MVLIWTAWLAVFMPAVPGVLAGAPAGAAEKPEQPQYWYSPPKEYDTRWIKCIQGICKGSNATRVRAEGPKFAAYVYYDLEDWSYDKRVIFTSYVQPMPDSCQNPNDCDGRTGNNEFDMVETGYVGFNSTWFINDNVRCDTKNCNGHKCWTGAGVPGCTWEGGPCRTGDYNNCNVQTNPDTMPKPCTWTDVQNGFSMCTQSAALDPMKQDFTKLSANGYLKGETGSGVWQFMPAGDVQPVNNQRAFSVGTGDHRRWGNRWIRLDLNLDGPNAWYSYSFFEPKPINDTSATVASIQKFGLRSTKGIDLYDKTMPHYWLFTLWQYDYEFAVPVNKPWDSMRFLHFYVVKGDDPTSHKIEKVDMMTGSDGLFSGPSRSPALLAMFVACFAGLSVATALVGFRWHTRSSRTVGKEPFTAAQDIERVFTPNLDGLE